MDSVNLTLTHRGRTPQVKRDAIIQAAFYACLAIDQTPSRRNVEAMIKNIAGRAFRHEDVARWLAARNGDHFGTKAGPPPGPLREHEMPPMGTIAGTIPGPPIIEEKSIEITSSDIRPRKAFPKNQPTLFVVTPSKPPPNKAWVEAMKDRVRLLLDKRMDELRPDDRTDLGMYHAWKFGNCTASERINRSHARTLAASFASMSKSPDFEDRTVNWYIRKATEVWEAGGRVPWFRPFDVRSRIEYEPVDTYG